MAFNCPHCSKDIENVVPLDRFQSAIAEKNAAAELASKAEKERAEALAKAGDVDVLSKALEEMKSTLAQKEATFSRETAFLESGITDPSVRELFNLHYARSATGPDAPDPRAWVSSLRDDPSKAPAVLSAFLRPAAPPLEAAPAYAPPVAYPHAAAGSPLPPPSAAPKVQPGEITAALRAGDLPRARALAEAVQASQKKLA